ncbi:MAG: hypothetical protein RIS47_582 [Bacteroidota bacterium]
MKLLPLIFVGLYATIASAQNLVPNSSFETYEECPKYYTEWTPDQHLVLGWTYPSQGTPDYYNTCAKGLKVGVPDNFMGSSQPRTGNAYVGIFVLGQGNYSEYIQTELIQPLEAGKKYCINYWYRLAQNGEMASDRLDLYFSNTRTYQKREDFLQLRPQVQNPKGKMLRNKDSWALYSAIYEAKGGELFMVIGNFVGYKQTMREYVVDKTGYAGKGRFSYYYIDDVSVKFITDCKECEGIPTDMRVEVATEYSAPTDLSANDGRIELKVTGGQPPYYIQWEDGTSDLIRENLPFATYKYTVRDHYLCDVSEEVTFFTAKPDTSYRGGNTGIITLNITGGDKPYKVRWNNGATEAKLTGLGEGDYNYVVTDAKGRTIEGTVVFSDFSNRLKGIHEGDAIVLDNIFFEISSIELLPQSYAALDKIVDFFHDSSVGLVEVSGHTDSTGSKTINKQISEGRAKTVVDYLVSKGIDKERIIYTGYGPDKPVAPNTNELGRQKNRRVEFKVIKK